MATKTATPWGAATLVEELSVPQRAGEKRFATIVQLLENERGERLTIPVKHGEGCWFADDALYDELEAGRQIVLRYAEPVNGSRHDVAGVVNERGNVMGLMPHPEHAVDPLLGASDGALILSGLVDAAREHAFVAA